MISTPLFVADSKTPHHIAFLRGQFPTGCRLAFGDVRSDNDVYPVEPDAHTIEVVRLLEQLNDTPLWNLFSNNMIADLAQYRVEKNIEEMKKVYVSAEFISSGGR